MRLTKAIRLTAYVTMGASLALAQGSQAVNFDIQTSTGCAASNFPTPCGAHGDPESVSWSGAIGGGLALIDTMPNGVGFPVTGNQYARLNAQGPVTSPAGGPYPRPSTGGTELCIPIPIGATGVSLKWDFYNAEGTSTLFNDGMSIDIVDATGNLIQSLAYADAATNTDQMTLDSNSACSSNNPEQAPPGPNLINAVFTSVPLPPGAHLSIVVWNGNDDLFDSNGVVDDIAFQGSFCGWSVTQPFGTGSLLIAISNCTPGATYLMPLTFTPGYFPNGWAFGVDIQPPALFGLMSFGPPFLGNLDNGGNYQFGPFGGLPVGLQLFLGLGLFGPGGFTGQFSPITITL